MNWFVKKKHLNIEEFCSWLDINFGNMGILPMSIATGHCGVANEDCTDLVVGEALIVTKIATFLYDRERRQIYVRWFDPSMKNVWMNWPVTNQTTEYKKEIISLFQTAIELYNYVQ